MLEAIYPTLASNLGLYFGAGDTVPSRTGNAHGGMSVAPYNVYEAKDGYVAIITVTEEHWQNLLAAMGREDLKGDPRFETNTARVENLSEVDAMIAAWVGGMTKAEAFAAAQRHHVPTAPVRDLEEVVNDAHMHERGMLNWIDHPDVGRIAAPHSPIRILGNERMPLRPAARLGAHNRAVYVDWLGLDAEEFERLQQDEVI